MPFFKKKNQRQQRIFVKKKCSTCLQIWVFRVVFKCLEIDVGHASLWKVSFWCHKAHTLYHIKKSVALIGTGKMDAMKFISFLNFQRPQGHFCLFLLRFDLKLLMPQNHSQLSLLLYFVKLWSKFILFSAWVAKSFVLEIWEI